MSHVSAKELETFMKFNTGITYGACSLLGLLLCCGSSASAVTITFNDLTDSPFVTVSGADSARVSFTTNPVTGCVGEVCTLFLAIPQNYIDGAGVGNSGPANIFGGPDDLVSTPPGALSDTYQPSIKFSPIFTLLGFTLTFTSDGETSNQLPPFINGARPITENGTIQLLDNFSWAGTGVTDTINFGSDVPAALSPEPGTVGLVLLSVTAGVLFVRRQKALRNG
jgi:hypothetical protein